MDVTEGGSLTLFTSRTSLSDYYSEKGEFAFGCSVFLQDLMANIKVSPELLRFPQVLCLMFYVHILFYHQYETYSIFFCAVSSISKGTVLKSRK
jgi:hypothetical protein